jgi:hypothetical protein
VTRFDRIVIAVFLALATAACLLWGCSSPAIHRPPVVYSDHTWGEMGFYLFDSAGNMIPDATNVPQDVWDKHLKLEEEHRQRQLELKRRWT